MALAFLNSLIASRGWGVEAPQILGTTKGRTMKVLPDFGTYKEAGNQKQIDRTCLV